MPKHRIFVVLACAAAVLLAAPAQSHAAELSRATAEAWDRYVGSATRVIGERLNNGDRFLFIDSMPDQLKQVRNGEIVVWPVPAGGRLDVPEGLIHHWMGAMFIPNSNLDTVFDVLDDYDSYSSYYNPTVVASESIDETGSHRKFSTRVVKHVMFITAAMDAQYDSEYHRSGANRWYSVTRSTRIQEIENYGQPSQRVLSPEASNRFASRLCIIVRAEERDAGAYIEIEAMALTKAIPAYESWFINPMVSRLSRSALVTSLDQTREAVRSYSQAAAQLVQR